MSNAANPGMVKNQERKSKDARKQAVEDIRLILSSVNGRRFFWRYLTECGVFKTSFTGNSENTIFLEGQRNIGLMLMSDLNEADPKAYITMLNENQKENQV